jgi:hypothetical protein
VKSAASCSSSYALEIDGGFCHVPIGSSNHLAGKKPPSIFSEQTEIRIMEACIVYSIVTSAGSMIRYPTGRRNAHPHR